MKLAWFLLFFLFFYNDVFSQTLLGTNFKESSSSLNRESKLIIDSAAIKNWYDLGLNPPYLCNDGQYYAYNIYNKPFGGNSLILASTFNGWHKTFKNATPIGFTKNNQQFVYCVRDSLFFLKIKKEQIIFDCNILSWKEPLDSKGEWMACLLKKKENTVVLINLLSGKKWEFKDVQDYLFANSGSAFLLKKSLKVENKTISSLQWVSLPDLRSKVIWASDLDSNSSLIASYDVDGMGKQVVFNVSSANTKESSIWYYKIGMEKAVKKLGASNSEIEAGLSIGDGARFSKDGQYIYISLLKPSTQKIQPRGINVDIWSYRDTILQSTQLKEGSGSLLPLSQRGYAAVVNVNDGKIVRLIRNTYEFIKQESADIADYIIVAGNTMGDRFWLRQADSNWIVSLKDGSRRLLPTKSRNIILSFSPDGKYLVYYDDVSKNYFNYELATGNIINLSSNLPPSILARHDDFQFPKGKPNERSVLAQAVGVAGWAKNGQYILVYDDYDVWKLDLQGKRQPVNITYGYGRENKIKFRLVTNEQNGVKDLSDQDLLLTAFDMKNKFNGFYRTRNTAPEQLSMGPYTYFHSGLNIFCVAPHEFDQGMIPVKAANINLWIVKRHSDKEAPNYYLTRNFKTYIALTDIRPQESYNWLTTELVDFEQTNGIESQGVLYKPENFDPKKKYPVIINYYMDYSHRLYEFPRPWFTQDAHIDIPWFVSRGYLVFTPDIYYEEGYINKSAKNSVVSAAESLIKMPFIDSKRIGICGHSFGGMETNYIATHSNMFAAIFVGAGTSNMISSGLQLAGGEIKSSSRLHAIESYTNSSLWENPQLYLEESSIFNADKVTSPMLIYHCKRDPAVPWEQAVEMFVALRRLEKKCWMLQYDEGSHSVFKNGGVDLTRRVTQFFDFYLKNELPPIWMTRGIRASSKGIETGLELDNSGALP